jgi:hypothetical protein
MDDHHLGYNKKFLKKTLITYIGILSSFLSAFPSFQQDVPFKCNRGIHDSFVFWQVVKLLGGP